MSGGPSLSEATAALTAPGQLFEMEEIEVRGVRTRVWKAAPPTLRTVLDMSLSYGEAEFLVYEDERVTHARHYRMAATLAHRLLERFGVQRGDRVAIAMRNLPEWVVAFWAAVSAGCVVVPLNAWWVGDELSYGLADSGSVLALVDRERAERIRPHLKELPRLRAMVVADEERRSPATWHEGAAGGCDGAAGMSPVRSGGGPELEEVAFGDALGEVRPDAVPPEVGIDPDDDATIFYTSGTTGRPKGAVGTHRNACSNLMSLFFLVTRQQELSGAEDAYPVGTQRTHLLSVPLFHATGCHAVLVPHTASGAKLVLMHHFDPERALELIEREKVTSFGGVPTVVMQVLASPDLARRDVSSVRSISYGGAPAPPELVRRIRRHFPASVPGNGYGLTETSSATAMNTGEDYVRRPDSVGRPVPVADVAVVPDGFTGSEPEPLGPGRVGELWVKGPHVVRGYWRCPEETARTFTRGWLHTGDLGRIDEAGFVYVVDRAKDTVIRGGENVYSAEVEGVLFEHEAVADCAVVGVPHDTLGEEVGAVVVLEPGAKVSAEELASHVAEHLAAYSVPTRIWFRRRPLPRNPAGKVLKRELRDEVLGRGAAAAPPSP